MNGENKEPEVSLTAKPPPRLIQWPQPNGLKDSSTLVYDFYEWAITPCFK